MKATKIEAGSEFPEITVRNLNDETVSLGKISDKADWRMVVVYRGQHCPMCTKYRNKLETALGDLANIGVEVIAVSGDSKEQLESHLDRLEISFPICHGLNIDQMKALGLYISHPRSEKETDHPFPEPGLFVINRENQVQVVDISNNPFVRPEIETLTSGLAWIKNPDNDYPIRGTYPY